MQITCLTGLDLTKQVKLFLIQHKQSSLIQQNKQVNFTVILPFKFVFSGFKICSWIHSREPLYFPEYKLNQNHRANDFEFLGPVHTRDLFKLDHFYNIFIHLFQ